MSSILTNASAMVALQTLQSINKNLGSTMSEISTGKSVANAKDNASTWAISQTMQSDVDGFKGISDALATGGASVAVARDWCGNDHRPTWPDQIQDCGGAGSVC